MWGVCRVTCKKEWFVMNMNDLVAKVVEANPGVAPKQVRLTLKTVAELLKAELEAAAEGDKIQSPLGVFVIRSYKTQDGESKRRIAFRPRVAAAAAPKAD